MRILVRLFSFFLKIRTPLTMIFDQLIKSVNQAIEKENVRKEKVQEKKVLKQTIKTLKSKGTK